MEIFFSTSEKIQHIIKSIHLTKTLFVSSIITGEANIGKKTLARHLFPSAHLVSGKNQQEVLNALEEHDELIITDFEKLSNQTELDFTNKRIIAVANYVGNAATIDDLFAFIYVMPPLQERPEDIHFLQKKFMDEAADVLMVETHNVKWDTMPLNLSANSKSMKKTIFQHLIKSTMNQSDIQEILYNYLYNHLEGTDNYREHLELYEKPLIEAGLKKFGSQLQLANALGINRNTLRKKIHEHNID